MKWMQIPLGPLQTNAYVIVSDNQNCVIIDPGGDGERLNGWIEDKQLKPLAILLTHAHFDHIGAVDEVREKWNIPVYLHKEELEWLLNPELNGSEKFGFSITAKEADHVLSEETDLKIGPFHFKVFETPGHSPGSVSFYQKESEVVFSGDALFQGSIGRTDLIGGSQQILLKSIHDKLLSLPEETIVAPGHGFETSIQQEMDSNPFLNGF